jgi:YbgC/YbaW family acyl-CoA thioester hydrolase
MRQIFIYGAYGYTGKLIVQVAVEQGLKPVLGGRNKKKLSVLASKYQLEYVAFDVKNTAEWDKLLPNIDLVINSAGPFMLTVEYVVPACLRHKVHYLDITGEIEVFRYIASLTKEAKKADIVLMPGVGFDVVPTDCLSAKLKERLPSGTHLELAFQGNSGISRGTALSMARRYHEGGLIRENGKLKRVPLAYEVRDIYFGDKERLCMTIPWGDVYTAYFTTGIQNIKVFTGVSKKTLNSLLTYKKLTWAAKTALLQWIMRSIIKKRVSGPSQEKRSTYVTYLWGRLSDEAGKSITLEMQTMESYQLTAHTAVESAKNKFTTPIQPRYGDFDMLGHLNNANYVTYFEIARLHYFFEIGWSLSDVSNVVAHFDIDFMVPVLPNQDIVCSIKTLSIGGKSFQMQYELKTKDGSVSFSKAHSVQVCIDKKTGKAIEIPESIRELITKYEEL